MATANFRWTVLPDGVAADGSLHLTVLVSPVLTGGAKLSDFGSGLENWPTTLAGYLPSLQVQFQGTAASATVASSPRTDRFPPADNSVWTALFNADTPVGPGAQAAAATAAAAAPVKQTLLSFPSNAVHGHVNELYQSAVSNTADRRVNRPIGDAAAGSAGTAPLPPLSWDEPWNEDLYMLTDSLKLLGRNVAGSYSDLNKLLGKPAPPPPIHVAAAADNPYLPYFMDRSSTTSGYNGDPARNNFAEAYRFYDRQQPAVQPPPVAAPNLDFLAACALLADYPELLRRFGLAVDLVVAAPAGLSDGWQARVSFADPNGALNTDETLRPWTALRYVAGQRFEPYAADTDVHGRRMFNLGDPDVLVTDLDVDGAAMKFVEFSRIFDQSEPATGTGVVRPAGDPAPPAVTPQSPTVPPALHGAGITVLYENRDAMLAAQMEADARNTAGVDASGNAAVAVLDASHLVRGYRVDVGIVDDSTGQVTAWYPLCARTGSYTIRRPGVAPTAITVAPDEGHVKASVTTTDKVDPTTHYVHQALFGWHGWSLAAPRPGRTIGTDNQPVVPDPPVSPVFPLDTRFQPQPGTLPTLRYGHSYRLRARLVDLAGNSLGPNAVIDPGLATATITYGRWEPVPPPVIVPRWPFLEGESEPRLVIRSTVLDDGTPIPPEVWAVERNAQVPDHEWNSPVDGLDRRYRSFDERHIAPPKTPLLMAEQHGAYAAAFGPGRSESMRAQYFAAASREAGTFLDTVVSPPEDPSITVDLKELGEIHVAKHNVHDTTPLTQLPIARGAGLQQGEYVVHTGDQVILPYLPDVPVQGVSLRGLPGADPNETFALPGPWPAAAPFRLRVAEGNGAPLWTGLRELTVFLPKATMADVRMSCQIDQAHLGLFRNWQALTGSSIWNDPTRITAAQQQELTDASINGENWLITPWVDLTLVHAVEKPLAAPVLSGITFSRAAGQTFAEVDGAAAVNAASTGQLAIDATWTEWVDDVAADAPVQVGKTAHVAALTLEAFLDQFRFGGNDTRHEFHDTRHRNVTYTATATTRFREYFHPVITAQPALITRTGPAVPGCRVPSSRRPQPPDVAYVVPTFTWGRTVDQAHDQVTQTRTHAGVRVYLNRPWFSSGDDEMLAVVLDPGTSLPDHLVTRCGVDPVWDDATVLPALTPANFPNAAVTATGQTLAEPVNNAAAQATIVAFAPVFDPVRKLWYADIDVNLGANQAYFPYLRLALARYQPYSVDPLGLSAVVLAEFAQIVPDRAITATETSDAKIHLELSGPATLNALGALAGAGQPGVAASREVTATVQRRGVTDGDLDWVADGTPLALTCVARGTGYVWSGDLTPPPATLLPLSQYRLLVEEHEIYQTDTATSSGTVTVNGTAQPVGRRLVHADYLALTTSLLGTIVLGE